MPVKKAFAAAMSPFWRKFAVPSSPFEVKIEGPLSGVERTAACRFGSMLGACAPVALRYSAEERAQAE